MLYAYIISGNPAYALNKPRQNGEYRTTDTQECASLATLTRKRKHQHKIGPALGHVLQSLLEDAIGLLQPYYRRQQ